MWYRFLFEDGFITYTRGYDNVELKHMILQHGQIRKKERV